MGGTSHGRNESWEERVMGGMTALAPDTSAND